MITVMNKNILIQVAGWLGMLAVLLAYALVSLSLIEPNSMSYHLLNLFGAIGIITVSVKKAVWQSVGVNVAWAIIASLALVGIIFYT